MNLKNTYFSHKSTSFVLVLFLLANFLCVSSAEAPSQIKELAGLVMVDSAFQVNKSVAVGSFVDLVEISTPTTPGTNHARLFLTPGAGSKQQLSIVFDDGTAVRITGN